MIKKYEEFNAQNESVLTFFTIGNLIYRLYKIYQSVKIDFGRRDVDLINEIKKITGKEYNINCIVEKTAGAWALTDKILYSSSLRRQLSHRELIAVILHETSHINNNDSAKKAVLSLFPTIPILLLDSWLGYFLIPIAFEAIINSPISKYNEYRADSEAKKYGYGEELASALVKLEEYENPSSPFKQNISITKKNY